MSAQSPVTAQVLAAAGGGGGSQSGRHRSRLQHVTLAEGQGSPSGLPHHPTPGTAAGAGAEGRGDQGLGQTPRGVEVEAALQGGSHTPRTGAGSVYMTPPTGGTQRPAVRFPCPHSHTRLGMSLVSAVCRQASRSLFRLMQLLPNRCV